MQLRFDGTGSISLPTLTTAAASFVGEGRSVPVKMLQSGPGMKLEPHKLAMLVALTREMVESSNAEAIIRASLVEGAAQGLDAALFNANAATADAPAGLLNGLAPLAPSTATPLGDAMAVDLALLGGSVARAAGADLIFVSAPEQSLAIALRSPSFDYPVLTSKTLTKGTVIAVAAPAIASAFDPTPLLDASREVEVQMADPASAINDGSGMSAPVASMYQSDTVALRLRMDAAWILRASGGISFMNAVSW
jgi:hypothetical protein